MRIALFLVSVHLSLTAFATTAKPSPVKKTPAKAQKAAPRQASRALDPEIRDICTAFFDQIVTGEYDPAMKRLATVFAINDSKRDYLAERMRVLDKKLGRAVSYELMSYRSLPGSRRVQVVYFATYHPLKAAVWELQFYRAPAHEQQPERWMVTSLRFESERLFQWLEGREP